MKHFQLLLQILTIVFSSGTAFGFQMEREQLFPGGDLALLKANIKQGTISSRAWREAIFAKKTNFDLPDYRKGLYGAETVAGTNLYLMYQLLAGHQPWMMTIRVNANCLPLSYDSSYSLTEGVFADWAKKTVSPAEFKSCAEGSSWNLGTFYDVSADPDANECVGHLERFLTSRKTPIVFDLVNRDSWYIRDRSCISKIEGTADQNLRALIDNKVGDPLGSRLENWYGDEVLPGSFFAGNTIFLLRVLADSHRTGELLLNELDGLKSEIDDWYPPLETPLSLKLDRNADNPRIVSLFLASAMLELRSGGMTKWRSDLQILLNELVKSFGKSCHGRHGVTIENRRSCLEESDRQSVRLIRFLDRKKP